MPRRIVLFTRDAGLTVALRTLLPVVDRVQQFESPDGRPGELDPAADTLVLDLPGELRRGAYRSIREWFPGRVVVLLVPGEQDRSFDRDQACRVLFRPFQLDDLIRELVVPPAPAGRRGAAPSGPSHHQAGGQSGVAPQGPAASDPAARPRAGTAASPPPGPDASLTGSVPPPPPGPATRPPAGAASPPPSAPARPTGAASPPPPAPDTSRAGTAPPPSPDASRARFPGGVDLPSRTASPGAPEKLRPDELDAAAGPDEPAAQPPLLFDWFASHGRRMDEAAADPPDNGAPSPTRRAPPPAGSPPTSDRGWPHGSAQEPPAMPDLGRPTEPWRPLVPTEEPPAVAGPGRPADPPRPPGSTERPPAVAGSGRPTDPPRPPTDLRRPAGGTPEEPAAKDPGRRVDPGPPGSVEGVPGAPGPGRPAEQRRPLTDLRRAAESAEASPAAAGLGRAGDQPPSSRPADRQSGAAGERGRDRPAASASVGEELLKRVVDLRTGLPRRRAGGRSEDAVDVVPAATAAEPVRARPTVETAPPGAVRA